MTMKATKQELHRTKITRNSWRQPEQRPAYAPDAPDISVTVLLYNKRDDIHALGWFNFDLDKWNCFTEYEFDVNEPFVWTYLPKP